ncbi:hypothetical protein RFN58_42120 [Streptomyces iakyrus]|uniref:hypothetical protein n=1 Tax=Streptomyces iakyrus TaxID=68219 RepID=UPI000525D81B|nr:hypothetical protein [Streptomyces iakyrus]
MSPFLGLTATEAHIAGDSVAVTWHGAAITRDRRPVNWSGISVFELDDTGRIREARAYFDRAAFQSQVNGG